MNGLRWDTGAGCLGILLLGFCGFTVVVVIIGCNINLECWGSVFQ